MGLPVPGMTVLQHYERGVLRGFGKERIIGSGRAFYVPFLQSILAINLDLVIPEWQSIPEDELRKHVALLYEEYGSQIPEHLPRDQYRTTIGWLTRRRAEREQKNGAEVEARINAKDTAVKVVRGQMVQCTNCASFIKPVRGKMKFGWLTALVLVLFFCLVIATTMLEEFDIILIILPIMVITLAIPLYFIFHLLFSRPLYCPECGLHFYEKETKKTKICANCGKEIVPEFKRMAYTFCLVFSLLPGTYSAEEDNFWRCPACGRNPYKSPKGNRSQ